MAELKTSWDLNLIKLANKNKEFEALRKDVEKAAKKFIKKWKGNTKYLKDIDVLAEALNDFEKFHKDFGMYSSEHWYFGLATALDQLDADLKSKYNKIHELVVRLNNEMMFFSLSLNRIEEKHQKKFLSSQKLRNFHHFLAESFKYSKHTLSDPEERIMNLKSKTSFSNWVDMREALLSKEERVVLNSNGKKEKKTMPEILELISDKNKKIRDTAVKQLNDIFYKNVDVSEHELNTVLENAKVNDEIRGYKRADESRHLGDDLDTEVVDMLVKTVTENFQIPKKYYKLKAKILKVKKLKYHERNIEVGKVTKKYKFQEAYNLVRDTFENIDPQFAQIYTEMFERGQVDVFPKKGKSDGAFCSYNKLKLPIYILLNHNDSLNNVLTIAHEFGHAFHFELSKKQNEINYDFPMCTAETASTFFEDFVLEELLQNANKDTRKALLMMKLNDDVSTIFRQVAAYNFEFELHNTFREKGYLGKDEIGKLFRKHMSSYMGDSVEQSPGSENWWVYWSHLRNSFYNYSYAFGLLVSKSLQRMVKEDKKNIKYVKAFLSAGSSKSPKEIFLEMGIDITKKDFWIKGINEINELLKEVASY